MLFMDAKTAERTDLSKLEPKKTDEFLVAKPIVVEGGVFGQYANFHKIEDLINYCSLGIDLGIINEEEMRQFYKCKYIIQGGVELGVYPVGWARSTLGKLEILGRAYLDKYRTRVLTYDSYQVRCVGFLSERLGSFFLLQELKKRFPSGIPSRLFGTLITISDDGNYRPGHA
jgi:hypothetical protein